jgi:DNA-binding NarL/FixJ family response regulator
MTGHGGGLRLLIADDQSLLNEALAAYLGQVNDFQEVRCVASLAEVNSLLNDGAVFDVVLLDLNMPGMNGVHSAGHLARERPAMQVAILSGSVDQAALAAATPGVRGFIPKTISGRALINVIRLIGCGVAYFPAEHLMNVGPAGAREHAGPVLTAEEGAVLASLRLGATNKEIARELHLPDVRVKSLIRSLSGKLKARNRTDIVIKAGELIG